MTSITSTSFGLVIGFLLPGLMGLLSLVFWSERMRAVFQTFLTAQSSVGLFLLVILAALTVGLMVTVVRWALFECWWCKSDRLQTSDFAALGTSKDKLEAFSAAVDAHYRYHQFWGGMAVVLPILYVSWLHSAYTIWSFCQIALTFSFFIAVEILTAIAAAVAYRIFVGRARSILTGG